MKFDKKKRIFVNFTQKNEKILCFSSPKTILKTQKHGYPKMMRMNEKQ